MPNITKIHAALQALYPDAICSLAWDGDPWRLLVMGMLSAQCTDERVNLVCPTLFTHFPTVADMARADVERVAADIRSCGFWRVKSQNLVAAAGRIVDTYGGIVPSDMDALLSLPGVGRKIANLVRGDAFGLPGIVADTHCIRINGRLGFYPTALKDPAKVERILDAVVPKTEQADYCHRMVLFGREYCTARSPHCSACPLRTLCDMGEKME